MSNNVKILWADDEIDLLNSHILYLENKGYDVIPVTNGRDAIDKCAEENVDVVFLDESMPGLSGLETLAEIKEANSNLPVVMITKNEEENLMEEAIGSRISDYLIKPVKPQQILMTVKKLLENKKLISEKTTSQYQQAFQKIIMSFSQDLDMKEWIEVYQKLIYWELELDRAESKEMKEVLSMQKNEANTEFNKFVVRNYEYWVNHEDDPDVPVMSHNLLKRKVFPHIKEDVPSYILLIDNLRLDQFKVIESMIDDLFRKEEEDVFCSILPTATQYSRNAIFGGMSPLDLEKIYPEWWKNDEEEGGKNLYEKQFFNEHVKRSIHRDVKTDYYKITNHNAAKNLEEEIYNTLNNDLTVIVYNFVDMLSHARTEMEVLKELASDEAAYRSITKSWFLHSPLYTALQKLSEKNIQLFVTSDHGTVRVVKPNKVVGDRNTTTNLRYKSGKNMQYNHKGVYEMKDPHQFNLPKQHVSSRFIFAKEFDFFVYPNNYNHYVNFFKDTFQHGGISLEEMLVPIVRYGSK